MVLDDQPVRMVVSGFKYLCSGEISTNGRLVVWGPAVWIFGITENERDLDS